MLALLLSFVGGEGTVSSVRVVSDLYLYGEGPCLDNSHCTTNLCINEICRCLNNDQCYMIGICQVNINNYCRDTVLYTDYSNYSSGAIVAVKGLQFTYGGPINFSIINSSNDVVLNALLTTASNGSFTYYWNTSGYKGVAYRINATDLNESITETTAVKLTAPYAFSGRIFNPANGTVPSSLRLYDQYGNLVAVDDEVYSFNLSYNIAYDLYITPNNISGLSQIIIKGIFNQGALGDMIGLDDTPLNNSDFTDFEVLIGIYPVISQYDEMILILNHSQNSSLDIFKCSGWNFTGRRCNDDDSWTKLADTGNVTQTNITLAQGDPGIGIGSPVAAAPAPTPTGGRGRARETFIISECGNKICEGSESCSTCPEDCGVCPEEEVPEEEKIEEKPKIEEKAKEIFSYLVAIELSPMRKAIMSAIMALAIILVAYLIISRRGIIEVIKTIKRKEIEILLFNKTKYLKRYATDILIVDKIPNTARNFKIIFRNKKQKIKKIPENISLHELFKRILSEKNSFMMKLKEDIIVILKKNGKFIELAPQEIMSIKYRVAREEEKIGITDVRYVAGRAKEPEKDKEILENIFLKIKDENLSDYFSVAGSIKSIKDILKQEEGHSLTSKFEAFERIIEKKIERLEEGKIKEAKSA